MKGAANYLTTRAMNREKIELSHFLHNLRIGRTSDTSWYHSYRNNLKNPSDRRVLSNYSWLGILSIGDSLSIMYTDALWFLHAARPRYQCNLVLASYNITPHVQNPIRDYACAFLLLSFSAFSSTSTSHPLSTSTSTHVPTFSPPAGVKSSSSSSFPPPS